jgi:hypothetical protein
MIDRSILLLEQSRGIWIVAPSWTGDQPTMVTSVLAMSMVVLEGKTFKLDHHCVNSSYRTLSRDFNSLQGDQTNNFKAGTNEAFANVPASSPTASVTVCVIGI